ncbi:hypothetical protein CHS0354_001527 [Potamilus streckersoni]|uniref:Uncharacterized protein n=1 Tax=Potamilus streckersoni TaxID=2493646 RepID=A0AAE0VYE6_9BIVA|nr:hypothetical protein CHS0354_001527 [Potamilus streckersoni]
MTSLKEKVIIITGASSGIGEATAVHLAELQPFLTLTGRNEDNLGKVAKQCEEVGLPAERILLIKADLNVEEDIKRIVETTIKQFGRIDVLVNNAGYGDFTSFADSKLELFDQMMRVNLRAPFYLCQLCAPYLIQTKGTIVNVSSQAGQRAFPNAMIYAMTKAGLDNFTKSLAMELAKHKVRVNSVLPGMTKTAFQLRAGMPPEAYEKYLESQDEKQPLGGAVAPIDVAKAIKFMASDESSFITGELLFVDGGRHTKPV